MDVQLREAIGLDVLVEVGQLVELGFLLPPVEAMLPVFCEAFDIC